MEKILRKMFQHRWVTLSIFGILIVASIIMQQSVQVNFNIMDYLPDEAPSTIALDVMEDEYSQGIPNARVMIPDTTIPAALEMKARIEAIDGIDEVTWLDDVTDTSVPLATMDQDMLESYYKDGNALFTLVVNDAKAKEAMHELEDMVGEDASLSGLRVNTTLASETINSDIKKIMAIAVPVILLILLLTTTSWFEPVLFLLTIGIAIVINSGTNLMFGEISFITQGVAAILQLAVSMDYAIFILHRFSESRAEGLEIEDAMVSAVKKSFGSVSASGVTTIVGFAALILMRIKIGPDVGWVMTKGIIISLICVFTLLPTLTISSYKLIDKTAHKSLMPSMKGFSKFVIRVCVPMLVIIAISVVPSYLAVNNNDFVYFDLFRNPRTTYGQQAERINEVFDESTSMVLLVGKDDPEAEQQVADDIKAMDNVTSVISYASAVGAEIPTEFVPEEAKEQLLSENYTRMVINVDTYMESEETFATVEAIRQLGERYYPDNYHLAGEACNTYDMKSIVEEDNMRVNAIAIAAVFAILLLTFKSVSIPFILIIAIESAIWMNCALPYFTGEPLFYIAYLVIGSLQLGATVDYAILFTNRYFEDRRTLHKREAMENTIQNTTVSILTSGSILLLCGFALYAISSNSLLSQLGMLVGRGALLSLISVLFALPAMLLLFDGVIQKTSIGLHFLNKEKREKKDNKNKRGLEEQPATK